VIALMKMQHPQQDVGQDARREYLDLMAILAMILIVPGHGMGNVNGVKVTATTIQDA